MSATAAGAVVTNSCPQCGAAFRCGMAGGDAECWCASLPALAPLPAASDPRDPRAPASCLCPACLSVCLRTGRLPRDPR